MSVQLAMFRCTRLNAKLTVRGCVSNFEAAAAPAAARRSMGVHAYRSMCVGCAIGADHQAGKPTPPELIVASSTVAETPSTATAPFAEAPRVCLTCSKPIPDTRGHSAVTCSEHCHHMRKLALERRRSSPDTDKVYKDRPCVACGEVFTPVANANRYCPACKAGGAKPTTAPNNKPLPSPPPAPDVEKEEIDMEPRGIGPTERHTSEADAAHTTDVSDAVEKPEELITNDPSFTVRELRPKVDVFTESPTSELNVAREVLRALETVPGIASVSRVDPKHAAPEDVLKLAGFHVVGALDVPSGRLVVRRDDPWHAGSNALLQAAGYRVIYSGSHCGHFAFIVAPTEGTAS